MKVLIIGTGYLGSEIKRLLSNSQDTLFDVYSTRRPSSITEDDKSNKILPLDILEATSFEIIPKDLDTIIYCVSANNSSSKSYEESYFTGVKNLVEYVKSSNLNLKKFILISSTGVYSENQGGIVTEESPVVEDKSNSNYIVQGENYLKSKLPNNYLILRLSGIYGPNRNYLKNLALSIKEVDSDRPMYTNRIHRDDASMAVKYLLARDQNGTYNVSDLLPEDKYKVLDAIRVNNNLNTLKRSNDFINNSEKNISFGKKISSENLSDLGFSFRYPNYITGYELEHK